MTRRPFETAREASPVLWPYTTTDDEGLPLSSPLPLSQPAVQAPHDNPDAPPSSESTGGDIHMEESDSFYYLGLWLAYGYK